MLIPYGTPAVSRGDSPDAFIQKYCFVNGMKSEHFQSFTAFYRLHLSPFAAAIDIPNFIVFIIADFTIFFKGFSVERIVSFRPVFLCTLYII